MAHNDLSTTSDNIGLMRGSRRATSRPRHCPGPLDSEGRFPRPNRIKRSKEMIVPAGFGPTLDISAPTVTRVDLVYRLHPGACDLQESPAQQQPCGRALFEEQRTTRPPKRRRQG